MSKSTRKKNAAKNRILTQSRDNSRKFSKTVGMENSDLEYSNPEYSDPEFLVFEFENDYEKDFNNEEIELNKEEVSQLIYENTSSSRLPYYSGGLKRTQQCKNKGLREAAQGSMSLDNFFKPVKKLEIKNEMSDSDISDSDIGNNISISEPLNKLINKLKDMKNMNAYEYLHFLAMHKYFTAIFNHEEPYSRIDLSHKISQQVFQHGPWMAHRIREWSKSWITTEILPVSKQGQQKYIQTLIDDKDVQTSCLRFIHTMGKRITAKRFQNYVQKNILTHITSSCTSISLEEA
ncbi:24487_t:CDS:2 [Gigaspora margarita]|uniref:24487_t:CDS:1 n=1 Tax=Gigaspora margarita TaxID=4874 RepID=A0ABN7V4H9_GIGMA|nr:24487_t:CDS:2 [Gigaspora margarita]